MQCVPLINILPVIVGVLNIVFFIYSNVDTSNKQRFAENSFDARGKDLFHGVQVQGGWDLLLLFVGNVEHMTLK